jgi:hypothetical protein
MNPKAVGSNPTAVARMKERVGVVEKWAADEIGNAEAEALAED